MNLAEIRKRAMYDPQSLSKSEWGEIHKAAFSTPKKELFDDDNPTKSFNSPSPNTKKKKKGWW